jgi:uncharacterized membrane protein YgdD (TMEM256/DUF423 family)
MSWQLGLMTTAGLYGALGVIAAAVAAHRAGGAQLATAAQMLLLHAVLVVALVAVAARSVAPMHWQAIATAVLLGAGLFSADVSLFALTGRRLFAMAAPTGGTILILSWAALAGLAAVKLLGGKPL